MRPAFLTEFHQFQTPGAGFFVLGRAVVARQTLGAGEYYFVGFICH
jgi:hypothetical protein